MGMSLFKKGCCRRGSGEMKQEPEKEEEGGRGNWGNNIEFFLSSVGYAVGFGNLWRFPYLCYRNGGGAFLIPYVLFLFLAGIPLVFMEMTLGQFAAAGPSGVWSLCPLAKGLGASMVMVSVYCCIYYNVIIMWTLYFLFNSFSKVLPWSECDNPWNTPECRPFGPVEPCVAGNSSVDEMSVNITCSNETEKIRAPYPAEEFWDRKVLARSDSIGQFITLRWDLALTLLLAWTLVFCCLIKGIKSSGKVVYVTATAPYILLTILLIQGATMEGSLDGVTFYMKPDFARLASPTVWAEACAQIFFSIAPAWGGLITMASYNKFHTNIYRYAVAVPLLNCCTSFYAGFVIFSVLGYMAKEAGVEVAEVVNSGPGLVFVAYPYALSKLPVPQLWAVLFFLMILTVGLDSQFGMFETFTTSIFDEFPQIFNSRRKKILFTAGFCAVSYLVGLFCCTHAGIYFFQLMDWYIGVFTLLFVSILECVIVGWIYGADRMYADIKLMIGYRPVIMWKFMWKFVSPAIVTIMLFYSLITYKAPVYNKIVYYPSGAIAVAWLYGISSSLPVPAYAAYLLFYKTKGERLSLLQKLRKYTQPSGVWLARQRDGPTNELVLERGEERAMLNEPQAETKDSSNGHVEKV